MLVNLEKKLRMVSEVLVYIYGPGRVYVETSFTPGDSCLIKAIKNSVVEVLENMPGNQLIGCWTFDDESEPPTEYPSLVLGGCNIVNQDFIGDKNERIPQNTDGV